MRLLRVVCETGRSLWDVTRGAALDYRPETLQVCFKRTNPSIAHASWLDRARHRLVMGDYCHCEVSYVCRYAAHPERTPVRISFVVNRQRSLEIKANKSYQPEDGWVVLDLPTTPPDLIRRSYAYSVAKQGTGMALNRRASCAGSYCGLNCEDLSVLDVAFACSGIFRGTFDSCLDTVTCGATRRTEEDGVICTELALNSLHGLSCIEHLRPHLTSPAQLYEALDNLEISPTATHYVTRGGATTTTTTTTAQSFLGTWSDTVPRAVSPWAYGRGGNGGEKNKQ